MKFLYICIIIACLYLAFYVHTLHKIIEELSDTPANWLVVSLEEDTKNIRVLCTNCGYLTESLADKGSNTIKVKEICPCCGKRMSDKLLEVHENITV